MAFDYYIVPEQVVFAERQLTDMRRWLRDYQAMLLHELIPNFWMVFTDKSDRDQYIASGINMLRAHDLRAAIALTPNAIAMSRIADSASDKVLYDFTLYCQGRWGCYLSDLAGVVVAEDLI